MILNFDSEKSAMRIWLVTVGEPLPSDGPDERLHRSGLLSTALTMRGHEVLWWSSTFDHSRKRFRARGNQEVLSTDGARIRLLHGPGYRRNVSFGRLANHRAIGRRFRVLARSEPKPDLIVASWPTIELSREAVAYGKAMGVPVVLDVRDLWPDIFLELAPPWAQAVARFSLSPMIKAAKLAFGNASAITGVTPAFVEWGLGYAGRPPSPLDRAFPLGYSDQPPSEAAIAEADQAWRKLGVGCDPREFVVAFVGTMGLQKLDMTPVLAAARALQGGRVRFVLCGDGDGLDRYKAMADGLDNVVFPGWVGRAEIWTLLRMASVGLAPYGSSLNYTGNLPNKPIEYLSAGLPILSSLDGTLQDLLRRHQCGITYHGANDLTSALTGLLDAPGRLKAMSAAASNLYRDQFVAEVVYDEMAGYLESFGVDRSTSSVASGNRKVVAS